MNKFCLQLNEYIAKLKKQAELLGLPENIELTRDNSKDWIAKFRNIDADMGDDYDIVHELLEVLKFMDRLHSQSKLLLREEKITGTGIVDPISPEMASKYLDYNSKDAELIINQGSPAFRSWLFLHMDRLTDPILKPVSIVYKGDLDVASLNFVHPHFINVVQSYFTVDGFIVLSPKQASDIGGQVLDNLKDNERIKGWKTKG
ncbi:hypothetical protein HON36_03165 [Candidatus Parcubacteria bacterium]|jgi:hypothetical protein|nr:hypothetical protein [Candidatus Parcubacteria bacterium]MBT7228920.1 hypothetical protein [Candidatus Parcubacteria bacterium]